VTNVGHGSLGELFVLVVQFGSYVIARFTGSAGQAIISKTAAYLVTDSRYWLQARNELDSNWHLILGGAVDGPKDWIDWLVVRVISLIPRLFLIEFYYIRIVPRIRRLV
jgi:hypothetical protein